MKSTRGFTLIEILVVIAIIGFLSSIAMANINNARARGRDVNRKTDLKRLQLALEVYRDLNNGYPTTGFTWYSSEPNDAVSNNGGNYIPGLASTHIPSLPRDPSGGTSKNPTCGGVWKSAYLYLSDGINYALLSHCAPETPWTSSDEFYDPVRPTWAWKVCSGPTSCAW
jgi:prepilin-type N-terminal cleavage/methylation domain-containing protein